MMEHPDLTYCREALNADGVNVSAIAVDTGISRRQLQYLKEGSIDNPGIHTIQKLADYLRSLGKKAA